MTRAKDLLERVIYMSADDLAAANNAIYLTGNPPAGGAIIRQYAITPTGKDFFSSEAADITDAYDAMPLLDPAAVPLWEELGRICTEQARELRLQYEVIRYDDVDPYMTSDEMLADIDRGVYKVTSLHSMHPVWNVDTNIDFRVAHDLLGHGVTKAEFSLHGEVLAYQAQCMVTPEPLWPALFTEIIGQVAAQCTHHFFGPQKVGVFTLSQEEIDFHVSKVLGL